MKKATAQAFANIALVKYWGKTHGTLRLPTNSSLSVAMDKIQTTTTVEFSPDYDADQIIIDKDEFASHEAERVIVFLNLIRQMAHTSLKAKVVTKNNFPRAVGAASSASGFAALSLAAAASAGLDLSEKELSILARQGSGSACRSVTGEVSVWHAGSSNETSFAERVHLPAEWNLTVLMTFTDDVTHKKIGSTQGMALTQETSPYYQIGVEEAELNVVRIQTAMERADWMAFGKVIEDEMYRLHALCMTTTPNILYWSSTTVAVFQRIYDLREQGIAAFFTADAGAQVQVLCQGKDAARVKQELAAVPGVREVVTCGVGGPAKLIAEDLF